MSTTPSSGTVKRMAHTIRRHRVALSIAVSIAMLALIVAYIGPKDILDSFRRIDPFIFLLACCVFAASLLCHVFRWSRIINATEYDAKIHKLFQFLLIDKFANSFFPTAALGIAARSWLLKREYHIPSTKGLATIVLDYGVDIFGTFVLAVPCYFYLASELPLSLQRTFQTSLLVIGLGAALVFLLSTSELIFERTHYGERIEKRSHPRLYRLKKNKWIQRFVEFSTSFSLILINPRISVETILLTFGKVILDAIRVTILFSAFDISVPFYYFILFDSAWIFLAPLMFTPGGVGVVESGRIALYSLIPSVSPGIATPVVFVDRIISYYLMVLIGGAMFFYTGTSEMMDTGSDRVPTGSQDG